MATSLLSSTVAFKTLTTGSNFPSSPNHSGSQASVSGRMVTTGWIRSAPISTSERMEIARQGRSLQVIGRNADSTWLMVSTEEGLKGWILSEFIATSTVDQLPISDLTTPTTHIQNAPPIRTVHSITALVTTDQHLRIKVDADSEGRWYVPAGRPVNVLARHIEQNWILVEVNGSRGWLPSEYLQINADPSEIPKVMNLSDVPALRTFLPPSLVPHEAENISGNEDGSGAMLLVESAPQPYTATLHNIGSNLRNIYRKGLSLGNNPRRFTTVGDSDTENPHYLSAFDTGTYFLDDYDYLQVVIDNYAGSFAHQSQAAREGYLAASLFTPLWSDPAVCSSNEIPLECEYRYYKPSISIIMVRAYIHDENWDEAYDDHLRNIVELSLDRGVIPVLSTIPYMFGGVEGGYERVNEIIRHVADEFNVPLWDLFVSTEQLPNRGVGGDNLHLSLAPTGSEEIDFSDQYIEYGMTLRNLETLEVLHAIMNEIHQVEEGSYDRNP